MTSDTRTRILATAAALFRRQGFTGTGLNQIAAESAAKVGSIYHFYPGGKDELVVTAVRTAGPAYAALVLDALTGPDPVAALRHAFDRAATDLAATGYADACPIATIAMEAASTNEPVRAATAEVFTDWIARFTAWYAEHVPADLARELALTTLSALEGAFVLARALRDGEPLRAAGRRLADQLSAALG